MDVPVSVERKGQSVKPTMLAAWMASVEDRRDAPQQALGQLES
jgi:hypothetical protein